MPVFSERARARSSHDDRSVETAALREREPDVLVGDAGVPQILLLLGDGGRGAKVGGRGVVVTGRPVRRAAPVQPLHAQPDVAAALDVRLRFVQQIHHALGLGPLVVERQVVVGAADLLDVAQRAEGLERAAVIALRVVAPREVVERVGRDVVGACRRCEDRAAARRPPPL